MKRSIDMNATAFPLLVNTSASPRGRPSGIRGWSAVKTTDEDEPVTMTVATAGRLLQLDEVESDALHSWDALCLAAERCDARAAIDALEDIQDHLTFIGQLAARLKQTLESELESASEARQPPLRRRTDRQRRWTDRFSAENAHRSPYPDRFGVRLDDADDDDLEVNQRGSRLSGH